MARLSTIQSDKTTIGGHRLLRYTAQIVNVGTGPFVVLGTRPDTSTKMSTRNVGRPCIDVGLGGMLGTSGTETTQPTRRTR